MVEVFLAVINNGDVNEGDGAALVLINLIGNLQVDITVEIETANGVGKQW